jgi:type 1 glutamine amidotransferase
VLRSLGLLVLLLTNGLAAAKGEGPAQTESWDTRILLIGKDPDHPWGSHMYMHTCEVLARCLQLTPGVSTQVVNGWPATAEALQGVRSIVVYTNPAAELLLDGQHAGQFDQLMKSGVGLVTIHWASTVYQENFDRLGKHWISYLGGTWISNVGLSTDRAELRQLAPEHPVCRGWRGYLLHDEFYLNPVLSPPAEPVLQVTTKGAPVVVGWAFSRPGGGRSYATTLGHFYKNFQDEPFRRGIVNAILWTAGRDVPADGAPVEISEADLRLPPRTGEHQ